MDRSSSGEQDEVRAEYDWASTTPSTAVVEALAATTGRTPTALEPLFESVDPDALDRFVRSTTTADAPTDAAVSLVIEGHVVEIRADGTVVVRPDDVE